MRVVSMTEDGAVRWVNSHLQNGVYERRPRDAALMESRDAGVALKPCPAENAAAVEELGAAGHH